MSYRNRKKIQSYGYGLEAHGRGCEKPVHDPKKTRAEKERPHSAGLTRTPAPLFIPLALRLCQVQPGPVSNFLGTVVFQTVHPHCTAVTCANFWTGGKLGTAQFLGQRRVWSNELKLALI